MSIRRILLLNLLGLLLLFSWWQTTLPIWPPLNHGIFFGFNHTFTAAHPVWVTFIAALNTRIYDVVSFLLMLAVLFFSMLGDKRPDRQWYWFSVGFTMLLTAGIIALFDNNISYHHNSPSLYFSHLGEHVNFLSHMVDFSTKDSAGDSFPGDHGMMLMVFASYVLKFSRAPFKTIAVLMVPIFSMPRIIAGAHWFEDVYMGSLSIALIILPWVLMTPLAEKVVATVYAVTRKVRRSRSPAAM